MDTNNVQAGIALRTYAMSAARLPKMVSPNARIATVGSAAGVPMGGNCVPSVYAYSDGISCVLMIASWG